MIHITINDQPAQCADQAPLQLVLEERQKDADEPFAVALNGEFVPRSRYCEVTLRQGDALDIVSPVGGG